MKLSTSLFVALSGLGWMPASSMISRCRDDPHFRYDGEVSQACDWISKIDGGCDLETQDGQVIGESFCPVTCGECNIEDTFIKTDETCYVYGREHILINFENEYAEPDDWLGLYDANAVSSDLGEPLSWIRLCGDRETLCKTQLGEIVFTTNMPPGTYKIVLAREKYGGPYSSYAETSPFRIMDSGSSCTARRHLKGHDVEEKKKKGSCKHKPSIQLNKLTYLEGEEIVISLKQKCHQSEEDFVAIYDADTELSTIRGDANYRSWLRTCGTEFCHQPVKSNVVSFNHETKKSSWPLPPGTYKAHLVQEKKDNGGFHSAAHTYTFTVVENPLNKHLVGESLHRGLTTGTHSHHSESQQPCHHEPHVEADKRLYGTGEEITISFKQPCRQSEEDFIAIYNADTELADIKGNANYHLFLRTCGTEFCHKAAGSNVLTFGATTNKSRMWPLPPGTYKAHLVQEWKDGSFHSAARSHTFIVVEKRETAAGSRKLEGGECLDGISTKYSCYEEGEMIPVHLEHACEDKPVTENDWIGFYEEEPNKKSDDAFFGNPIKWAYACPTEMGCFGTRTDYFFWADMDVYDDEDSSSWPLSAGMYRVVWFGGEYRHGGPYEARSMSHVFTVVPPGQECPTRIIHTDA